VNDIRVKLFTITDQLLVLLLLPSYSQTSMRTLDLCANPADVVSCNNLYLHYDKTKANSKGVEGSFSIEVTGLADRLLSHVYDISLHWLVT
jgi:hypothetical protein